MRAAFPIPNCEPRVCRWGCSAAPAAEGEQQRRAQGSGGVAEAAEVRAGELLGPPRLWGNGLAARRGRPGGALLLVAVRHAGTLARPAPSAPGLGARGGPGRRRRRGWGGLLRRPARPAQKGRDLPGPWLPGLRAGRRAATCLTRAARRRAAPSSLLPPRALRRGPGWGRAGAGGAQGPLRAWGAVRGRRHPLRREWRLRHEWRAAPGGWWLLCLTPSGSVPRGGDSAGFWRVPGPQVLAGGGFRQLLQLLPRHETPLVKVVVGRAYAAPEAFAAEAVFSDLRYINLEPEHPRHINLEPERW